MMFECRQAKLSRCAAPRSRSWLGKKHPTRTWAVMRWIQKCFGRWEKKEEEGLKVSTKFFSVVSKFACSYMNSCTICCCFPEQITAAELQTFFFFYTMSPFWARWTWCSCDTQRLYSPKHHRKRLERDLSVNLNGIEPLWAESSSPLGLDPRLNVAF